MPKIPAFAAPAAKAPLARFTVERRELGEHDVAIDILYCGVCHPDVRQARNGRGRRATSPDGAERISLFGGNKRLAGSLIGGIAETQEVLDYCAEHQIVSEVEVVPAQKINEAHERMLKADVRYGFLIDIASLNG